MFEAQPLCPNWVLLEAINIYGCTRIMSSSSPTDLPLPRCITIVTFEHAVDHVDEESDDLFTTESVRLYIQESSHVT